MRAFRWPLPDDWRDEMTTGRVFTVAATLRIEGVIENTTDGFVWRASVLELRHVE